MLKQSLFLSLAVGLISLNTATAQKLIEKVEKKGDEIVIPYEKYMLDNGMTLLIHVDKSDPVVHVDVTYHVVEDEYFNEYMHNLFRLTNKYVLIYSINSDNSSGFAEHLKNRKFVV